MPFGWLPKQIGFGYALLMVPVIAYLWYTRRITRRSAIPLLFVSTALGFLLFAPVAPFTFQHALLRDTATPGVSPTLTVFGMGALLLLSLCFGRIFCGHLCPVGAVQELVYLIPAPKFGRKWKQVTMAVRAVVFLEVIGLALYASVGVIDYFGIKEFFYLSVTTLPFYLFVGILVVSILFYRPFCRLVCPYGLLLSLTGAVSVCKFRRTDACIQCGKCERACPTGEAGAADRKAECYLCGRCVEVCPVEGALKYSGK